jgi:hypothetical protein
VVFHVHFQNVVFFFYNLVQCLETIRNDDDFFFIIIKVLSTIAIEQPPCQIQMEFAPLWHEKELAPRKRHWMVWFSNACEKENDCSWLANHNDTPTR